MKNILLKISWEVLKWEKDFWFDEKMLEMVSGMIAEIKQTKINLAIVIWWGNIYRWSWLIASGVTPADSHNLSMLSTVFNWVVLKNFLEKLWLEAMVMDANWIRFLEKYNKDKAWHYLDIWKIVIIVGWTWNPYFSTDTAWVLRALELNCDMMIKATRVDWVYDSDPEKNKDAIMYDEVKYSEVLAKWLRIMDLSAIDIAKNNSLILKVVNIYKKWSVLKAILWEKEWTIIKE